jgi:RNA polymerase sigma-70 factor (ECF subfamily)
LLFGIAYRMLGTVTDAEDIVQEAFLRRQQTTGVQVLSEKSYLAAAVTRLCIDHLRSARVRCERYVGPWLPEPLAARLPTDPMLQVELADSLSTAFLVMLENLTPLERAVFLLHEVFDYGHIEIGRFLGKSPANCRQILKRARNRLAGHRPRLCVSHQTTEQTVIRFLDVCSGGDLDGLLSVLAEGVTFCSDGGGKVAATLRPLVGARKVARFLLAIRRRLAGFALRTLALEGQIGVVIFANGNLDSVLTFEVDEEGIQAIYSVRNPDKLHHFTQNPQVQPPNFCTGSSGVEQVSV